MATQTPSIQRLKHLLPQLFAPESVKGNPFLKAQLTKDITVGVPLSCVEEVRRISADMITPMPNMPHPFLGLTQAKGHIFWLIDLAKLVGLDAQIPQIKRHEMIMVRTSNLSNQLNISNPYELVQDFFLGFSVQRIKGILRLQNEDLKDLEDPSMSLSNPYFRVTINKDGESISMLNI